MRAFVTPRLHMRPLTDTDEALYCQLYMDPVVMRHIAPAMTRLAAERDFRTTLGVQGRQRLLWVIADRSSGHTLGLLGAVSAGADAEVGVMLLPGRQGQGIATEVLPAAAIELSKEHAIERLWTRHAASNGAAAALMRRLGFQPMSAAGSAGQQHWEARCNRWDSQVQMAIGGASG